MSTRMLIGIVLFCVAMTSVFLGNLFFFMMIGEVNRKRPDGEQISYFGHHYFKTKRIFREYRYLYPEGNIHIYMVIFSAVAFSGMVGVAVCMRVIGGR
ncbi:MAG: hypothetical protein WBD25_15545 [Terriglobales bacterium]